MPSPLERFLDPELLRGAQEFLLRPSELAQGARAGQHASGQLGFAMEFAGHREYAPGDDARFIDWRVSFRRELRLVRLRRAETETTLHLIVDASGSMAYGEERAHKGRFAASLAMLLAHAALRRRDPVSLAVAGRGDLEWSPASGLVSSLFRLAGRLDSSEAAGSQSLSEAIQELAPRLGRRGVVVVVTDGLFEIDPFEGALSRLCFDRHKVVMAEVAHRDEQEFPFQGTTRFRGLENEEEFLEAGEETRAAYLEEYGRHRQALQAACDRLGVERLSLVTDRPIADALAAHLSARRRVPGYNVPGYWAATT